MPEKREGVRGGEGYLSTINQSQLLHPHFLFFYIPGPEVIKKVYAQVS